MKTKLQSILQTLSEKDILIFKSLIPTKLMEGTDKHLLLLTDELIKSKGKQRVKILTVYERLLMSDLFKMAEKFVIIKEALQNKNEIDQGLFSYYRKNENEKLFIETYNRVTGAKNKIMVNADYHQNTSDIQFEKWQYDQVKSRFSNAEAKEIIHHYDIALISKKLMQAVTLGEQSSLISKNIDLGFIDPLESYILQCDLLVHPCISLYYYALKLIYHPDEAEWFEKFVQVLEENKSSFPQEEIRSLYFKAINYSIRKFNNGDKEFGDRLLDYYRIALQEKYLLTNGYLSRITYRNLNTLAIRMDKFDEAEELSTIYVDSLRTEDKESAFSFNMANIYYAKKLYDKAIYALQKVDFDDDHLSNLFAKKLLMKVYFETNQERALDSHLDAMQVYITRKKIIGYHKTTYTNIIKYTRKIMNINPYDKKSKLALAIKVRNEKLLPDRDWVLSQLEG